MVTARRCRKKILILSYWLLSAASFPLLAQGPDLPGPEFAHPTATLPLNEIRIGAEFRYLDDIHDHGPGPGFQDPDKEPMEYRSGSFVEMREAFLVARWGISESIELAGRIGLRQYRPGAFDYADGEFYPHIYVDDPGFEIFELTAGPKIELHSEQGMLPDITFLSTVTYRWANPYWMESMVLGNTTRVLLRNTVLEAGEIRYSLGLNTRLEQERFGRLADSQSRWKIIPSYTLAALLRLGNSVVLGPEVLGEYAVPDPFRYDPGMRHWFGMGIRVSGEGLPDIMLAARTRSTFDTPTYQGQLSVSFAISSLAINESRR